MEEALINNLDNVTVYIVIGLNYFNWYFILQYCETFVIRTFTSNKINHLILITEEDYLENDSTYIVLQFSSWYHFKWNISVVTIIKIVEIPQRTHLE